MATFRARGSHSALVLTLLVPASLLLCAVLAGAQSITEFPLPSPAATHQSIGSDLHAITVGPDDALWFNESGSMKIGRISLQGRVTEFPTPDATFGIATGSDGNLWFTIYGGIGRMTTTGAITLFPIPPGMDPSEVSPFKIVRGPDDAMWFSVEQGYIGRITMAGAMTLFPVPSSLAAGGSIFGISFGPDGNLWYGSLLNNMLGRMTPSGGITEFPGWAPEDLTIGPDGALWGCDGARLGRVSTADGTVQLFQVPASRSLGVGPDGNLWVSVSPTSIGKVTPGGSLTEIPVPATVQSPLGVGSFPWGFVTGPDGNVWFTEEYTSKIGRVNLKPAAALCTPDANTLCLNSGRFAVTATFQSASGGPTLDANAISLTDASGYFWFFDSTNVELVVKVLNGCGINNAYWVFGAGLTNVGVHMSVKDLLAGTEHPYDSALGTPFAPIQDTSALSTCP